MKPIKFKEQTEALKKPTSMTDKECGTLPIYREEKLIISCWKCSWKERIQLLFTGRVWLWVHSSTSQPPVFLGTKLPFIKRKK